MADKFASHVSTYPKPFFTHTTWKNLLLPLLMLIIVAISVNGESIEIYECQDPTQLDVDCISTEQTFDETRVIPTGESPEEFAQKLMQSQFKTSSRSSTEQDDDDDDDDEEAPDVMSENPFLFWEPPLQILVQPKNGPASVKKFRMKAQKFECPPDKVAEEFFWHPKISDELHLEKCSTHLKKANIKLSNMSIIEDGKLVYNKEETERHVYRKDSYCVSRRGNNNEWVSFKVCTSNCSATSPCVRKCCPPSKVIDANSKECVSATPDWRPIFYKSASQQEMNTEHVAPNASIVFGFPDCPKKYMIERNATGHRKKYMINGSPTNNFKLLLDGTLVQIDGVKHTYIKIGEFCIDGINYNSKNVESTSNIVHYSRSEWDQVVIACIPTEYKWEIDKWRMPLYATLNHISALFLLVTDIVYILLWKHQNIHGWLQFAYATSLFFTFNCFVVVQRWSTDLIETSKFLCKVMGWITHLTYLSAFFWLTSMNFDLWWRFSRPLKSTRLRPQETKWRRFLAFAIFSIVVPLMISGIGITLDSLYEEDLLEPPFTIPGFGKEHCYFESKRSQIPYLYGPAGVLLLVDMIFFTSTVLHLRKIHAHTELARTQSTMEDKKGLKVIFKLFIVMGVLWILELIKWIAHIALPEEEITLIWIFIPADILNSLQGVAIFFIFIIWKPNVGSQLLSLFRKDEAGKTWNKQTQFPSLTVQQPSKANEYSDAK